jgi:CysZ protein
MSKLRDIRTGVGTFIAAYGFIRKNGMSWLFIVPVLLWLLGAILFFWFGWEMVNDLSAWIDELVMPEEPVTIRDGARGYWDNIKSWMTGSASTIASILASAIFLFVAFFLNKYVVLIVMSPVMAYASERTEEILTGKEYPFVWKQFLKDILRGILIALRNGGVELAISVVIWIGTLVVPFLAPVSAVLLFLVSSYFYGFSTFDYVHERRRSGVRESIRNIREDRWTVIANGAAFNLIMKVPLLGMIVGPLMASVGACTAFVEKSVERGTTGG